MIEAIALIALSPVVRPTPPPVVQSGEFICNISDAEGNIGDITIRFGNHIPRREIEGKGIVPEQMRVKIEGWGDESFPEIWSALRSGGGPGSFLYDSTLRATDWGSGHFRISRRSGADGILKGSISVWRAGRHTGFIGHCFGSLSLDPVDLTQ
jgi:hypothetical protein